MTGIGPNAQQPSYNQETFLPDQLVAGVFPIVTDTITVTGAAALKRGTVLGAIGLGAVTGAAGGGNVGNGTIGTISRGLLTQTGIYALACSALTSVGTFDVFGPDGVNLGTGKVGTVFTGGGLTFTQAAGAVDFTGGDEIDIAIALGTASSAAKGGNTGNGTMGAVTVSAGATAGAYKLTIVEPGANAGIFTLTDPFGVELPTGTVGVAYSSNGLAFTLADGASDFVSGDQFTITVAPGTATTTAKAGNVGNGATGVVTVGAAETGTYRLVFLKSQNDGAIFSVTAPNGARLADAVAGAAFSDAQINFTITEGGTKFALKDTFTLTVAGGSTSFKKAVASATDGSQNPMAVLLDDADASGGDVTAGIMRTGEVNARALIYDGSFSAAAIKAALAPFSIFVKSSVSAAAET